MAVFGVLAKGRFATAIDTRLYLPKEWTDDAERCDKADIPQSERVFKTKNQLALEIVEQARRNGVRLGSDGDKTGDKPDRQSRLFVYCTINARR